MNTICLYNFVLILRGLKYFAALVPIIAEAVINIYLYLYLDTFRRIFIFRSFAYVFSMLTVCSIG